MSDLLQSCITELQKPPNERNNSIIITYLRTLPAFVQMLKQDVDKFPELLTQIAKLITFVSYPKHSLIIKNGEKGSDFYITLSGLLQVFAIKPHTYSLTEEEYLFHLFKLRDNQEPELLKECIRLNNCVYPIGEDNFDNFVKNIAYQKGRGQTYQDSPRIIARAKETLKKLHVNPEKDKERYKGKLTIEEYLDMNKVELLVTDYSDEAKQRKNVTIPMHEMVNQIETGQTFGDVALENPNSRRTATLISVDDCYFGVLDKNEYTALVKGVNDKNKRKFFSVIYSYSIFQLISKYSFEKRYYNFFKYQKCERNEMLVIEGSKCDNIYFLLNGEFEVIAHKNVIDVNKLLIQYKQTLIKLSSSGNERMRNCVSNFAYVNYVSDEKENEDLLINQKFKTKAQNEMILMKQNIRLGTANNRDIIGLYDFVNMDNGVGLISCKCLSNNCEMYFIPVDIFYKIYDVEESVRDLTNEFFVKKLKMMIDKLNEHKERVFVMMDKHEEEKALIHYNMNKQNKNKFNKKNRLYKVEHNSVFNYKRLNKSISPPTAMTVHNQPPMKKHKRINVSNISNSINTHHRPFESISTSREVVLPKLNVKPYVTKHNNNNNSSNSTNSKGIYSKKFKQQFLYANLYDNVFDSYVTPTTLTTRKLPTLSGCDDDKSNYQSEIVKRNKRMIELSPSFDHCKTESNEMNLIDCLIMDRFNSCYSIALNNINSGSSSNNNTHRIKYN